MAYVKRHKRVKENTWLKLFLDDGDISPIEEAEAFFKLHKKYGMNINKIASKTNRSAGLVSNRIKLAKAPFEIKEKLEKGEMKVSKVMSSLPRRKYIKRSNKKETISWFVMKLFNYK